MIVFMILMIIHIVVDAVFDDELNTNVDNELFDVSEFVSFMKVVKMFLHLFFQCGSFVIL